MPVTTPPLIEAMRRISELLRTGAYRAAHDELEPIVAANPGFVQAQRLHEPGVGRDDRFELVVCGAVSAGPQQLADAPHGLDERRGRHGHGLIASGRPTSARRILPQSSGMQ